MWDLLGPGIEPVSSALVGRFLTTGLSGKSPMMMSFVLFFNKGFFFFFKIMYVKAPNTVVGTKYN